MLRIEIHEGQGMEICNDTWNLRCHLSEDAHALERAMLSTRMQVLAM